MTKVRARRAKYLVKTKVRHGSQCKIKFCVFYYLQVKAWLQYLLGRLHVLVNTCTLDADQGTKERSDAASAN